MSSNSPNPTNPRGRDRGRSRGGLGKYLRARGRRGGGRPAEFHERLVLEDERPEELEEEEATERTVKYSRRHLGTNIDRYDEPEPELGEDGKPVVEPEIDLSHFLERQGLLDENQPSLVSELQGQVDDEADVDHSLDHLIPTTRQKHAQGTLKKGKIQAMKWDEELESMVRESAAAEARRDLKERLRAKSEALKKPLVIARERKGNKVVEAPPLPSFGPPKEPKAEMEEFLDSLLG